MANSEGHSTPLMCNKTTPVTGMGSQRHPKSSISSWLLISSITSVRRDFMRLPVHARTGVRPTGFLVLTCYLYIKASKNTCPFRKPNAFI